MVIEDLPGDWSNTSFSFSGSTSANALPAASDTITITLIVITCIIKKFIVYAHVNKSIYHCILHYAQSYHKPSTPGAWKRSDEEDLGTGLFGSKAKGDLLNSFGATRIIWGLSPSQTWGMVGADFDGTNGLSGPSWSWSSLSLSVSNAGSKQ